MLPYFHGRNIWRWDLPQEVGMYGAGDSWRQVALQKADWNSKSTSSYSLLSVQHPPTQTCISLNYGSIHSLVIFSITQYT